MSEWNYTQCAKPFPTLEEARSFMTQRGFAGHILRRDHGGYTAVCPTYPEGYYPDAISVETISVDQPVNSVDGAHLNEDVETCCD